MKRLLLSLLFISWLFYPAPEKLFAQACEDNEMIPLSKIIQNPEQYEGKEITVVGRYEIGLFCINLVDENDDRVMIKGKAVPGVPLSDIIEISGSQSCVTGVFIVNKGPIIMGCQHHLEMEKITSVLPLSQPDNSSPIGLKLAGILVSKGEKKAIFEDSTGAGHTVKEGVLFRGVLHRRLKSIERDWVVIEEYIPKDNGKDSRLLEMDLNGKYRLIDDTPKFHLFRPYNHIDFFGFKLTGILISRDDKQALLENSVGKGYIVREGEILTGRPERILKSIEPDKIIVEEYIQEDNPEKVRLIEIKLEEKPNNDKHNTPTDA